MTDPRRIRVPLLRLLLLVSAALQLACTGAPAAPPDSSPQPIPDLSGHWEVDYGRSDSVQTQLNARFREIQRELRRRQDAIERGAHYQGVPLGDPDGLIALAQMAELITEPSLLEIRQTGREVRIKRENSFALICNVDESATGLKTTGLGQEQCWWDGQLLHFFLRLPDGLSIHHQFTRSADGRSLSQATSVSSPGVGTDFQIAQIFTRFDPAARGYRCTQTLSRGLVCTTERDEEIEG
jgi:hypothetical protein